MKKFFAAAVAATMLLSLAGCGSDKTTDETKSETFETSSTENESVSAAEKETSAGETADSGKVMTYEEYAAADIDTAVVVETYVQAKQAWWENKATIYTQAEDGAYFIYEMACTEEEYAKLTAGTKIKVSGYKSEWSGEVEIVDASFEIIEGDTFIAKAEDVTSLLSDEEEIKKHQNQFVAFKGMTVMSASEDSDEAFLYKWDGSGSEGDDLYFRVSVDDNTYTFTVESYLCDKDTDVYKAVKNLKAGDVVDLEGFLYWYEGINPHITSVTVK